MSNQVIIEKMGLSALCIYVLLAMIVMGSQVSIRITYFIRPAAYSTLILV